MRSFFLGLLVIASLAWPCSVRCADQADHEAPEVGAPRAPVVVDGVPLFWVRGSATVAAEERADAIAGRIKQVARNPEISPDDVKLVEKNGVLGIYAGDLRLVAILEADARAEEATVAELADLARARTRSAITGFREDRDPKALLRAAGFALVATLAVLLAILSLRWIWGRGWRFLEDRARHRVRNVGVASVEVVRADQLWQALRGAAQVLRGVAFAAVLYVYLYVVLSRFPWTRGVAVSLGGWIVGPLVSMGQGLVAIVPNVIFLVILFYVTRWVLRLLKLVFKRIEKGHVEIEGFFPEWAAPTYNLARIGVIVFAIVVAFPYIPGSDSLAFKGLSVFLGVLLSLGSSSAISNVVAGYTLVYRRAFKVGDRVLIGDVVGEVSKIRLQVTHVRTYKNEDVVIPNSQILGQDVTNYTTLARTHGLILHTTVNIGYETPWRQVEALLLLAASRTTGLLPEPAPFVLQLSLGEFAVAYELNAACDDTRALAFRYADLHRNILDVFNEHGVQIMVPAYEGDPEKAKVVPKDRWYASPAKTPGDKG